MLHSTADPIPTSPKGEETVKVKFTGKGCVQIMELPLTEAKEYLSKSGEFGITVVIL